MNILDPVGAKKFTAVDLLKGMVFFRLPVIFYSMERHPVATNEGGREILYRIQDDEEFVAKMFVDLQPGGFKVLSEKIGEDEFSITVLFSTSATGEGLGYIAVFKNISDKSFTLSVEEMNSLRQYIIEERRMISNIMLVIGALKPEVFSERSRELLDRISRRFVTVFNEIEAILNKVSNRGEVRNDDR